ncbi:hypothetical protein IT409_02855 [Candidatus Falkowbacteria bacterium]|nr:hypothetical protein [Candidatus Falkowbacteria bacterium]
MGICGLQDLFLNSNQCNEWDDFEWTLKNNSVTRISPYYYLAKFEGKNFEEAVNNAKKFPFIPIAFCLIIFTILNVFFLRTTEFEFFILSLGMILGAGANYIWVLRQLRLGNYVVYIMPKPKEPDYASSGGGGYGDSGGGFFYGDGGAGAAAAISCGDGGGAC